MVVLTGQGLYGKNSAALGNIKRNVVHLGLGEYRTHSVVKEGFFHIFRIIAVKDPQTG